MVMPSRGWTEPADMGNLLGARPNLRPRTHFRCTYRTHAGALDPRDLDQEFRLDDHQMAPWGWICPRSAPSGGRSAADAVMPISHQNRTQARCLSRGTSTTHLGSWSDRPASPKKSSQIWFGGLVDGERLAARRGVVRGRAASRSRTACRPQYFRARSAERPSEPESEDGGTVSEQIRMFRDGGLRVSPSRLAHEKSDWTCPAPRAG